MYPNKSVNVNIYSEGETMNKRYEVVKTDRGYTMWYIWDTKENVEVCDPIGSPVYYLSYEEAAEAAEELNA